MKKKHKKCSMCQKKVFAGINGEWLCRKHFNLKLRFCCRFVLRHLGR